MFRFAYRALQRVFVLEGVAVLVGETCRAAARTEPACETRVISREEMIRFSVDGHAPYCDELAERLDNKRLWCFGVLEANRLLSFAWFCLGSVEAEMNRGYCPATATAIQLADDAAFVFNAYTTESYRGRGLMTALLATASRTLQQQAGVTHLVATTELINRSALAAFARAGIEKQTAYWRYGIGPCAAGWYPQARRPVLGYGS